MKPIVVHLREDKQGLLLTDFVEQAARAERDLLLIGFTDHAEAVVVLPDGRLRLLPIAALQVELGNPDFPIGYEFSRMAYERRVPA